MCTAVRNGTIHKEELPVAARAQEMLVFVLEDGTAKVALDV